MIYADLNEQQMNLRFSGVISDSNRFLTVKFNFDDYWDNTDKTAIFLYDGKKYYVALADGNSMYLGDDICYVPAEVIKSPGFKISVYGMRNNTIITSSVENVTVEESGYGDTVPADVTPSIWLQLIQVAVNAERIANSVVERADAGEFHGEGVVPGGTAGQVLAKNSNDDFDTDWIDLPEGMTVEEASTLFVPKTLKINGYPLQNSFNIDCYDIGAYEYPENGIPISDMSDYVKSLLEKAETALQSHQDISGKENISNKATSISSSSTDTQYPSAKAVVDYVDEQSEIKNYNYLSNKPQINGVTLSGNKTLSDLGVISKPTGGTLGQVLAKTLHDETEWINISPVYKGIKFSDTNPVVGERIKFYYSEFTRPVEDEFSCVFYNTSAEKCFVISAEPRTVALDGYFYGEILSAYEITGGGGSVNVVQKTGQSTEAVMSQKAVTDELSLLVRNYPKYNIFDYKYEDMNWSSDIDQNGDVISSSDSSYLVTDFIELVYPIAFRMKKYDGTWVTPTRVRKIAFYDADKEFISFIDETYSIEIPSNKIPENAKYVRLRIWHQNEAHQYERLMMVPAWNTSAVDAKQEYIPYDGGCDGEKGDIFQFEDFKGKTLAVIGDSITTWEGHNASEIIISSEDVGVELSAYVTKYDVGTVIGGYTITNADIGTELTFTPTNDDIGKEIGKALTHAGTTGYPWWQHLCKTLDMSCNNVSWSGSSYTSHESVSNDYKCSYAWHESQIRKCGTRIPGTMTRTAPDIIILARGVNDFSHSNSVKITNISDTRFIPASINTDVIESGYGLEEALNLTLNKLRTAYPNAKVYICTITAFKRNNESGFPTINNNYSLPQFNKAIKNVAEYNSCGIINMDKVVTWGRRQELLWDTTHPSNYAHHEMYKQVIKDLLFNN